MPTFVDPRTIDLPDQPNLSDRSGLSEEPLPGQPSLFDRPSWSGQPRLPAERGPLSRRMLALLTDRATAVPPTREPAVPAAREPAEVLADDDLQLALWLAYELHYRGLRQVPAELEWDPAVLAFRSRLETTFLNALVAALAGQPVSGQPPIPPVEVPARLAKLVADDDGPPLSTYLQRTATRQQFVEFVQHRSLYQLKEADPHSWGIPRLAGAAKAALVEIQADEYGGGRPVRMHSELFRQTMRELGLSDGYGDYLELVPGCTLAISNLMSLFGLHRRWRGALAGHLAVFEMTSSIPNARYARGIRRLGGTDQAAHYYEEHVEADAVHEQLAAYDLCGSLAAAEPELAGDILFGGAAALVLDAAFGRHVLDRWAAGRSSLR
jgi:hypothetical protein